MSTFQACSLSTTPANAVDDEPKLLKSLEYGIILITKDDVFVTSNFQWLCENVCNVKNQESNNFILKQPIANLVELENLTKSSFILNFMDELENIVEKWNFTLESCQRISVILETIDVTWKKVFSMSLMSSEQMLILKI